MFGVMYTCALRTRGRVTEGCASEAGGGEVWLVLVMAAACDAAEAPAPAPALVPAGAL